MRRRAAVLAAALLCVLALAPTASAQSFTLPAADVRVQVEPDGSLRVVERITYAFVGDFTGGYLTANVMSGAAGYTVVARDSTAADQFSFVASVSGSTATFTFEDLGALEFQRMVPAFELCNDASVPPR